MDKELLLDFYNSRGYRNATILRDSIYDIDYKTIGIDIDVSEGNKYYIRDISWVGNSIYTTEQLQEMFGVQKGRRLRQEVDAQASGHRQGGKTPRRCPYRRSTRTTAIWPRRSSQPR